MKENMFARFDITHNNTSHMDTLWKAEVEVDPTDTDAVNTAIEKFKADFAEASAADPAISKWTSLPVECETDDYGIVYKAWDPVYPSRAECNGNDPKHWGSQAILRIVRPVTFIRNNKEHN